jgi:cobalamin biosynthesis Mg chelatase CobN
VELAYTRDGVRREVTRSFRPAFGAPANPGEITLTGVDAVSQGGSLELSATASNVGSTEVESVVVSTNGSDVGRADYFVGSVDGSDFASFTLSTSVSGNLSTVPVQVSYVVDGAERSYVTEVPVQQAAPEPQPSGGGGLPVVPIVGGVVVLGLLVAGYRYLR